MRTRKPKNKRKSWFQIVFILFLTGSALYGFLRVDSYLTEKKIQEQEDLLDKQNKQLETFSHVEAHHKLLAVQELENSTKTIPRSLHIPKVIAMLEGLKDVDVSESETVILSDFIVNLDNISLKGKVSNLILLYINAPEKKIKSLIDRFAELDFIEDIRIQTYEKSEWKYFEFVLNANVINTDGSENNK